jgi:protein phosphatase 2C family protein 2/3
MSFKVNAETNKNRDSQIFKTKNTEESGKSLFPAIISPKPIKLNTSGRKSSIASTNTSISSQYSSNHIDFNCNNNFQNVEIINVNTITNNQNIPISINNLNLFHKDYDISKSSNKQLGVIKSYAANTYQGLVRNYNEDRVSIILNIAKPNGHKGHWPKCCFFGIYDGHGGSKCADFLRDNLHNYIIKDKEFPENPAEALRKGFEIAEKEFTNTIGLSKSGELIDNSGSCAVVCLLVEEKCYIANLGDSRAIVSYRGGKLTHPMTIDHKPNEERENRRIIDNGGRIYQTTTPARLLTDSNLGSGSSTVNQIYVGPYRVLPGRLSVSRTFGDIEAKLPQFGGIPGVVIATPEISSFQIKPDVDFLVLGCKINK